MIVPCAIACGTAKVRCRCTAAHRRHVGDARALGDAIDPSRCGAVRSPAELPSSPHATSAIAEGGWVFAGSYPHAIGTGRAGLYQKSGPIRQADVASTEPRLPSGPEQKAECRGAGSVLRHGARTSVNGTLNLTRVCRCRQLEPDPPVLCVSFPSRGNTDAQTFSSLAVLALVPMIAVGVGLGSGRARMPARR